MNYGKCKGQVRCISWCAARYKILAEIAESKPVKTKAKNVKVKNAVNRKKIVKRKKAIKSLSEKSIMACVKVIIGP
jgi:hypothetical protein